jgi:hypothetical protein
MAVSSKWSGTYKSNSQKSARATFDTGVLIMAGSAIILFALGIGKLLATDAVGKNPPIEYFTNDNNPEGLYCHQKSLFFFQADTSKQTDGQKAELDITAQDQKGNAVPGTTIVTGADSIHTKMHDGSAYFLLQNATVIEDLIAD